MIQSLIHRFLLRRHFWRHATFSEIAELYASRLLTMFALRFVMVFASVYLYKLGYSVSVIALIWCAFYFLKIFFAWPAGLIIARFGPKHGILYANIIFAVALCFLGFADRFGVPVIIIWLVIQGFAGTFYNLCYQVDFSKVKHAEHAGKEIGYMNIVEKIAAGVSPLVGGIVASLAGPASAIVLSILLFLLSAVPLFRTAEPTKLHQDITLKGFPWRIAWRSIRANLGFGVDVVASSTGWVLFISAVIFTNDGNELYAKIGAFTSVSLVVALVTSYLFGKLIDRRQGLLLLRSSVVLNSMVHLLRPGVSTATGIVISNAVNEMATTGYSIAFVRGEFDMADTPGYRIAYLSLMEISANLGAFVAALLIALLTSAFDANGGLKVFFVLTAFATLLIATPRFTLYQR